MSGSRLSRRQALKTVAAAVGGSAALGSAVSAQSISGTGTTSVAGRKFYGWVSRGFGANATTLQEMTLLPISGRQVLVRPDATQCCYTTTNRFLGIRGGILPQNENEAQIEGHGGVGIVEAVGPEVRRVQVGDRVIVNAVAQCGQCYGCAKGGRCQAGSPNVPIATLKDGTPVNNRENMTGGLAELMVIVEEKVFPIFTSHSSIELAHLPCVGACGLGMIESLGVTRGSSIVIFGAGPVGLTALQGAKLAGSSRIIVVEPMKVRRDIALKLGATDAVDPNELGADIVNKLREMVKPVSDRFRAGGGGARSGPDFIVEAVGHSFKAPKGESGPDGSVVLKWAWDLCTGNSRLYTCGVGYDRDVMINIPANQFADSDRWHMSGPNGRAKPIRDLPRWSKMIEKGQFDAKSFVTVYPLEKAMDAYAAVADRTIVSAVVTTKRGA